MGKKKNKNKISGAAKTAVKTEKKLASKLKKELANLGEEDITKVIAEIEREEAKRSAATEKTLPGPPSARAYASLTPHPVTNEIILFGGEYHNGKKTEVYNDLLIFNPEKKTWRQVKAPGGPPPRSAHQAVATAANKGELWIFGGEYTSPTETQFHHYKDLWCFSFAEKKWEKVVAANGPSPRSGHRMALLGRSLVLFGGYCDDGRASRYFDDVYSFCLDTRRWKCLKAPRAPAPRAACLLMPSTNSLTLYGGFSRVREGKSERTYTHTDLFRLVSKGGNVFVEASDSNKKSSDTSGKSESVEESFVWRSLSGGPLAPPSRAAQAAAVNTLTNRAYIFGGISDMEETEEELRGEMSNELLMLDLETGKWHDAPLRGAKPKANQPPEDTPVSNVSTGDSEKEGVTVVTDEVFTMKLGANAPSTGSGPTGPTQSPTGRGGPSPRMSAMMAVQRSVLYLYGGVLERDDKQFYLADMYSLDLHKMNEWKTIIEQPSLPAWFGSDDEDDSGSETGSDSDSDSDTGSDSDDE